MARFLSLQGRVRSLVDAKRLIQPQLRKWWPGGNVDLYDFDAKHGFWFSFPDTPNVAYKMDVTQFSHYREVVRTPELDDHRCR